MNDEKRITQQDIDDTSVRLKPILGVKPGHYLAALYGLAAALALFFLLLYPGLKAPGEFYSFIVDPPGAAVYVDGVYKVSTPARVFLPAGERAVRVERPGFEPRELSVTVKARVLATLFKANRADMALSLDKDGAQDILALGMREYAAWSLVGLPSETYQLPMSLSDAARAWTMGTPADYPAGFSAAALSYAGSAASARDALRATAIAAGGSTGLGPVTLGRLVSAACRDLASDPTLLYSLASASPEARAVIEGSGLYRRALDSATLPGDIVRHPLSSTAFAGLRFMQLPAGRSVVKAGEAPALAAELDAFALAVRETTVGDYRAFIAERPEWAPESTDSLLDLGLVDREYLKGFAEASDDDVLRYVSKHAALAYCGWLSAKAPAGTRCALPTEAQWAFAAVQSGSSARKVAVLVDSGVKAPLAPDSLGTDAAGFKGLYGNVWEWCSDPYAPSPSMGSKGRSAYPSGESVVRGASWANRFDKADMDSRGPMPDDACTAYLGFRVALVADGE